MAINTHQHSQSSFCFRVLYSSGFKPQRSLTITGGDHGAGEEEKEEKKRAPCDRSDVCCVTVYYIMARELTYQ